MSSLERALQPMPENYEPIEVSNPMLPPIHPVYDPGLSRFLRTPLPPINVSPDNLRQFYGPGMQQFRVLTPPALTQGSGSSGSVTNNTVIQQTTSTTTIPTVLSAAFNTPLIAPGTTFFTTVQMAKAFTILQIGVSNPGTRVLLYSTAIARSTDAGRDVNTEPAVNTQHGVICDITVDANWILAPAAVGANGDSPSSNTVYVSVGNVGSAPAAVNVGISYVEMAT